MVLLKTPLLFIIPPQSTCVIGRQSNVLLSEAQPIMIFVHETAQNKSPVCYLLCGPPAIYNSDGTHFVVLYYFRFV